MRLDKDLTTLILLIMASNFNYRFGAIVCATLALAACSRKEMIPDETIYEEAIIEIDASQVETKTVISDNGDGTYNILWSINDQVKVYEQRDGDASKKSYASSTNKPTSEVRNFGYRFSLPSTAADYFDYSFFYPNTASSEKDGNVFITMPKAQTFEANSFDKSADILMGEHLHTTTRPSNPVNVQFQRVGATAKMTVKGITSDEIIKRIRFSTGGENIAGKKQLNLTTSALSAAITDATSYIDLYPAADDLTLTGSIPVWFRLYEATLENEFTVTVKTDKAIYTKTVDLEAAGKTLEFHDGGLTTFTVNMGTGAERTDLTKGITYTLVTEASQLVAGDDYIFVGRYAVAAMPGARFAAMSVTRDATTRRSYTLIPEEDKTDKSAVPTSLIVPEEWDAVPFTLADAGGGQFAIIDNDPLSTKYGKYLYTTNNNEIKSGNDGANAHWTITIGGDNVASVQNAQYTSRYLLPNLNANMFRTYTGEQSGNKLYIYRDNTGVRFTTSSYEFSVGSVAYDAFTGQTATVSGAGRTVTYSLTGAAIGTINSSTGAVTLNGSTGTATVKVSVNAGAGYSACEKSYTITVSVAYPIGGWLEMPTYSASSISSTTTSSLMDLYQRTHKAMMGGKLQRNYTYLYDPEMYASYWVAYPLTANHLTTGREDSWAYDPDVPSTKQTNCTKGAYGVDYGTDGNYYARGHQIPNADRNNVADMQAQTYYMTNITPQIQNRFNSGIWNTLEAAVRDLTASTDTVYVVTGAAFKTVGGSEAINTLVNTRDGKELPIPNYYWKALLKVKRDGGGNVTSAKGIGFWLTHEEHYDAYTNNVCSIDELETKTGLDLFPLLPDEYETTAESNTNWTAFQTY